MLVDDKVSAFESLPLRTYCVMVICFRTKAFHDLLLFATIWRPSTWTGFWGDCVHKCYVLNIRCLIYVVNICWFWKISCVFRIIICTISMNCVHLKKFWAQTVINFFKSVFFRLELHNWFLGNCLKSYGARRLLS